MRNSSVQPTKQYKKMRKSLFDISWQVSEPEYRADPALSYSTLAKYERDGRFKALPTLFDHVSTPSLVFGSIVDTLMTGSEEEFRNNFVVLEDPGISDTLKEITLLLYSRFKNAHAFDEIPDDQLSEAGKECDFYANDKYEATRIKKIRESCKPYYNMLLIAEGKTVVSQEDIADARACVEALKNGNVSKYFTDDPFGNSDIEGFYQLKFKGVDPDTGVEYRCMADRIIVNHAKKYILPIDLKTSSHEEHEFFKSFTQWRYDIQARLYWRLIKQNIEKDEYFKDFKLLDYQFIVVNRKTLTPLAWEFSLTQALGQLDIPTPSGYQYHFRDPYVIGKELREYLDNPRRVPFGISMDQPNNIVKYIENN